MMNQVTINILRAGLVIVSYIGIGCTDRAEEKNTNYPARLQHYMNTITGTPELEQALECILLARADIRNPNYNIVGPFAGTDTMNYIDCWINPEATVKRMLLKATIVNDIVLGGNLVAHSDNFKKELATRPSLSDPEVVWESF